MATHVKHFSDLADMLAQCDQAHARGDSAEDHGLREHGWVGRAFNSWAEASAAATALWPEGLDIVQEMLFELRDLDGLLPPRCVRRKARWSADGGDEVEYDRLRAGQGEFWRTTAREEQRGPTTVTVFAAVSTSACRKPEEILWRGAAAIVLADLLEKAGYRVELVACNHVSWAYRNDDGGFQAVTLKHAEQPLDIAAVVNGLAGWFFRTVFFQAYHVDRPAEVELNYGNPRPISPNLEPVREIAGNSHVEIIDGIWSRPAAVAKVRQVVEKLNQ